MMHIHSWKFFNAVTLREAVGENISIQIECSGSATASQTVELHLQPTSDGKLRPQITIYYSYTPPGFKGEKVIGQGSLASGYATLPIELDCEQDFIRFKSLLKAMLP